MKIEEGSKSGTTALGNPADLVGKSEDEIVATDRNEVDKNDYKNVNYLRIYMICVLKIFRLKFNNTLNHPLFAHFVLVVYVLKTVEEKIQSGTEASGGPAGGLDESKDEGNLTNEVCRENSKTKTTSYIYT